MGPLMPKLTVSLQKLLGLDQFLDGSKAGKRSLLPLGGSQKFRV